VALAKLGEPAADAVIRAALGGLPDGRLIAARARAASSDRSWVEALQPLLESENALFRVLAAEQLLSAVPGVARPVLRAATAEANPLIRAEAARVLASERPLDRALMRHCLRDGAADVRLHAAGALLAASASAPPPPPPRR
jgi:hypothetical protein